MRSFEVVESVIPQWAGMSPAARVVAEFLARVRVTGDPVAARRVLAPVVLCHQVVSEAPETVERTPEAYAAHVRDMREQFGPFRFVVAELISEDDRIYVRWQQHGHLLQGDGRPVTDVGSAVYRVADGRIVEYWVQLDRLGLLAQIGSD